MTLDFLFSFIILYCTIFPSNMLLRTLDIFLSFLHFTFYPKTDILIKNSSCPTQSARAGQHDLKRKEFYVMFRLWGKEIKDNHLLRDTVICDETDDTRTHKIFHALDQICYEFDLSKPIWLDSTIADFKRSAKARFYQDSFIDTIDFDYLEIQIIEE